MFLSFCAPKVFVDGSKDRRPGIGKHPSLTCFTFCNVIISMILLQACRAHAYFSAEYTMSIRRKQDVKPQANVASISLTAVDANQTPSMKNMKLQMAATTINSADSMISGTPITLPNGQSGVMVQVDEKGNMVQPLAAENMTPEQHAAASLGVSAEDLMPISWMNE